MIEGSIDGVKAVDYRRAMAEWDAGVGEWNALVEQRDNAGAAEVVVAGTTYEDYESWAKAHGKPLTFEAVLARYR